MGSEAADGPRIAGEADLEAFARWVWAKNEHQASSFVVGNVQGIRMRLNEQPRHALCAPGRPAARARRCAPLRRCIAAARAAAHLAPPPPRPAAARRCPSDQRELTEPLRGLVAEMALTGIVRCAARAPRGDPRALHASSGGRVPSPARLARPPELPLPARPRARRNASSMHSRSGDAQPQRRARALLPAQASVRRRRTRATQLVPPRALRPNETTLPSSLPCSSAVRRYQWALLRPLMSYLLELQLRRFDQSSGVEVRGRPKPAAARTLRARRPARRLHAAIATTPKLHNAARPHAIHNAPLQVGPARPVLLDGEALETLIDRLRSYMDGFDAAPWTAQRLAELLLEPGKQYRQLHKLVGSWVL